jgi:hypothetical protein
MPLDFQNLEHVSGNTGIFKGHNSRMKKCMFEIELGLLWFQDMCVNFKSFAQGQFKLLSRNQSRK